MPGAWAGALGSLFEDGAAGNRRCDAGTVANGDVPLSQAGCSQGSIFSEGVGGDIEIGSTGIVEQTPFAGAFGEACERGCRSVGGVEARFHAADCLVGEAVLHG